MAGGGELRLLSSSVVQVTGLEGGPWVLMVAGGLLANLALAAAAGAAFSRAGPLWRRTWWTHAMVNLSMGAGYLMFAPVFLAAGVGDTGALADATAAPWAAAASLLLVGGAVFRLGRAWLGTDDVEPPTAEKVAAWWIWGMTCSLAAAIGTGDWLFGLTTMGPTLGAQSLWVWKPCDNAPTVATSVQRWSGAIWVLLFLGLSLPLRW